MQSYNLLKANLDNRVAIVTGSSRGIGEATAKILAANGATVVVNGRNIERTRKVAEEIKNLGAKAFAVPGDVSKYHEAFHVVDVTLKSFDRVDILFNNAGIIEPTSVEDMDEQEWDRMIEINLKSVFSCSRAVLKHMKERRYGKIINMSSTAGKTSSTLGGPHYSASKAGVLGFTRHLARELAPYGVNVNAICPGIVDTDMLRSNASRERIDQITKSIPMNKLAEPEDVAYLVLFLVSDASSFITGASIDIDGGELIL